MHNGNFCFLLFSYFVVYYGFMLVLLWATPGICTHFFGNTQQVSTRLAVCQGGMALCINTIRNLLFVSHFNWRMNCCLLLGMLPLSVLLQWYKALEVVSLRGLGRLQAILAGMQCAKAQSGCFYSYRRNLEAWFTRHGQSSCTLEPPNSSYAESYRPFTVHPQSWKEVGGVYVWFTVVVTSQDSPSVRAMGLG